jgi:hypothetical protein
METINQAYKDGIIANLKERTCEVTFTTQNGDVRVMQCTLMESALPLAKKDEPLTQKKVRAVSEEVCVVYDVKAPGWRSFRWDSVTDFKLL